MFFSNAGQEIPDRLQTQAALDARCNEELDGLGRRGKRLEPGSGAPFRELAPGIGVGLQGVRCMLGAHQSLPGPAQQCEVHPKVEEHELDRWHIRRLWRIVAVCRYRKLMLTEDYVPVASSMPAAKYQTISFYRES